MGRSQAARRCPSAYYFARVVVLASLAAVSCTGSELQDRESENGSERTADPANSQAPQISPQPLLVLGTGHGADSTFFLNVTALFGLSDDRIMVSAPGSDGLLAFDRNGERVATIGRTGRGPGEFSSLGWARTLAGDTILAWDPMLLRTTVIAPDGSIIRTEFVAATIPTEWLVTGREAGAATQVIGATAAGRLIAKPVFGTDFLTTGRLMVRQDTVPLAILSPTGEPIARIGPVAGSEYFAGQGNSMLLPFGGRLHVAIGSNRIAVGDGRDCRIDIYAEDGHLVNTIRHDAVRMAIGPGDIERYSEWFVGRFSERTRPSIRADLARVPFPDTAPCFSGLLWDRIGKLWVQSYVPPQDASAPDNLTWYVFDEDGGFGGAVTAPPGLELRDIGNDYVLGTRYDSLGVEIVQLHSLSRSMQ
jgi:hypothetical protein